MWELDCKESWGPKNWCFWTGVLEKTLESPLDCKEIKLVHPKGNKPWIFIGGWSWNSNTLTNWFLFTGKDLDAGKDWRWEENGDNRGWDGWMASQTRWTWVWANCGTWWTGKPGVLQSMGSQRNRHNWATELTDWWNKWMWSKILLNPHLCG